MYFPLQNILGGLQGLTQKAKLESVTTPKKIYNLSTFLINTKSASACEGLGTGRGGGGGGCLALKMYFEIFILGLSMKYVQLIVMQF